jgi:superfamily II DNA or RNA helicase
MEETTTKQEQVKTTKLLPYQHSHADNIAYTLKRYGRALDLSQTGTGKSYVSASVCVALKMRPLVICPKSLVSMWPKVLKEFGVEPYGVANYEMLQFGNYMVGSETKKCPYIKKVEVDIKDNDVIENDYKSKKRDEDGKYFTYEWQNLPNDVIVIFDEAHRCKNGRTFNGIILHTLAETDAKILLLSATLADKPETFVLPAFVLRLVDSVRKAKMWIYGLAKGYLNPMSGVHDVLFPEYASRMRSRDVKGLFPDNRILADCYEMENAKEIEKQYMLIEDEINKLKTKEDSSNCVLAKILYARMRIEQLKIPTFLKLAKETLENGNSVAIFVNFTDTLKTIQKELDAKCVIYGQQSIEERDRSVRLFNQDKERVIICNIRSGGVGISLHDTIGDYPKVSIISPSWSAQDILQALGRIHRANGKTPVVQKIVFCKGTIEEDICKKMTEKIKNIAQLNDGDLLSHQIEGLTDGKSEDGDSKEEMSELGKMFMRMEVLETRRKRLMEELKEAEDEMKELQKNIQSVIS